MKSRFIIGVPALTAALIFLLTGCLPKAILSPKSSDVYTSPANAVTDGNVTGDNPTEESAPSPADEELDCNWTLYVDQTIPKTTDGLKVNYTLLLIAQKAGGTDVYGSYKGAVYVGVNFDASQMSSSVMQMFGGFNVNAYSYDVRFEVVPYNEEKYTDYGLKDGEPPLAPLVTYESMALISPELTGSGTLNPSVNGPQGESGGINESSEGTTSVPMKISIESGKVTISIPSLNLGDSFKGVLTGEPTGDSSRDDQIAQTVEKIEGIIEDSQADADAASGSGSAGGLSDILGQFKPN